MPDFTPPPQGALSQAAPPPGPAMPPAGGPPMPAGGPPPGPGAMPPAMPGGPPAAAGGPPGGAPPGPPVKPPKPGNEGLINRVLGLISGETKQKERMEHQQALVEAMKQGAQQALQGVASLALNGFGSMPGGGGGDPTDQIRGLMAQAGPPQGGGQGFARGGYPDLIGLPEDPRLPQRTPFATGGGSHFVPPNGMSGRSDQVDARLSPNEYVMDAETVSMLGDGSADAGAKKLDQMRSNVRRHKGAALAKGKFSPNARKPESYLS